MTKCKTLLYPVALAATCAAAILPASIQAEAPARYALTVGLHDDGALIANPRLEVTAGAPAMVEVGDDRAKVYNFVGTITPTDDGTATVSFRYTIVGQDADGAATSRAVESAVAVNYGNRVELQFGKNVGGADRMALSLQVDKVQ